MKVTRWTRALVIALAGTALVSAAPAAADSGRSNGKPGALARVQHRGGVVLRRDGSMAMPFRAYPGAATHNEPMFRRDGSKAVAFVPDVGTPVTAAEPNRFDWGDAAVGAASVLGLALLASGALILVRRNRTADVKPTVSPDAGAAATRG
jgi:LPXTG-motif cell wall-anchored protein